jgi:uncharacterized membrane protein YfcA
MLAALAAVLLGSTVQSGVGFGFALVAAPVIAAFDDPRSVPATLALLSMLVNVLTITAERRPAEVLWPVTARLVAWSVPGMALGAVALVRAPVDALRILIAVAVLAAVAAQVRMRGLARVRRAPPRTPETAAVGALSGALATSTGLNGPPLVLHLLGRATPAQTRDTLAAVFFAGAVLTLAVLAAGGALEVGGHLPVLAAAAVLGWVMGRRAFARLGDRHQAASLLVLFLGASLALVLGVRAVV